MLSIIRLKTVTLIRKLLKSLTDENLIGWNEYQEIVRYSGMLWMTT